MVVTIKILKLYPMTTFPLYPVVYMMHCRLGESIMCWAHFD